METSQKESPATARIAKVAYETNRTIRQAAQEISGLDKVKLDALLDPAKQT